MLFLRSFIFCETGVGMDGGASGDRGRGGHGVSNSRNTALGTYSKAGANGERGDFCRHLLSSTGVGLIFRLWMVGAGVVPLALRTKC